MPSPVVQSEPIKLRLKTIRDVIAQLNQAKSSQESSKNPSAGKGVWINFPLWRALTRQLHSQIAEIHEWEQLLLAAQQEAGVTRQQVANLEGLLAQERASMHEQQRSWAKQQEDLTQQTAHALKMLQEREQVVVENEHLVGALREAQAAQAQADIRAQEAVLRAAAAQQQSDYFVDKTADGRADRAALAHQVRDLSLALSHARAQIEQYRQQQGAMQHPGQELMNDLKRLKVDNERLVGLLGETKAWKRVAKDLSTEGGSHYVPVEEALVYKGSVDSVYTPLRDRPFELAPMGSNPEEWHWVPKQAVAVALEAISTITPTVPTQPLLHVLLSINKIWRQREEKKLAALKHEHAAELRELHRLYRQRAPYEAIVGNTKLSDLKKQLRLQAAHAQQLAHAEAGHKEEMLDDSKMFLALGLDSINSLNQQVTRLQSRNNRLNRKLAGVRKPPPLCPACAGLSLLQAPLRSSSSPADLSGPLHSTPSPPAPASFTDRHAGHPIPSTAVLSSLTDRHAVHPIPSTAAPASFTDRRTGSPPVSTSLAPQHYTLPEATQPSSHSKLEKPSSRARPRTTQLAGQESCEDEQIHRHKPVPVAELSQDAAPPMSTLTPHVPRTGSHLNKQQPSALVSDLARGRSSSLGMASSNKAASATPQLAIRDPSVGGHAYPGGAEQGSGFRYGSVGGDVQGPGKDQGAADTAFEVVQGGRADARSDGADAVRWAAVGQDLVNGAARAVTAATGARRHQDSQNVVTQQQGIEVSAGVAEQGSTKAAEPHGAAGASRDARTGGAEHKKRAAHLARLIHKYEQPVLRFSLWDRDGSLHPGS